MKLVRTFKSSCSSHFQVVVVVVDLGHVGEGTRVQPGAVAELPVDVGGPVGRAVHKTCPRVGHSADHGGGSADDGCVWTLCNGRRKIRWSTSTRWHCDLRRLPRGREVAT